MSLDALTPNPNKNKESLPVKIGHLDPNRSEEYRDLRLRALKEEPIAFEEPLMGEERLRNRKEESWRDMIGGLALSELSRKIILVADINGKLVGTVGADIIDISRKRDKKEVTIQNVFVTREDRGQGISKRLMLVIIDELKGIRGVNEVALRVYGTQEIAIKLYLSLGFEIIGEPEKVTRSYHGINLTTILMKKKLR